MCCSFDVRGRSFAKALYWSDTNSFGPRAYFMTVSRPAALSVENVQLDDNGVSSEMFILACFSIFVCALYSLCSMTKYKGPPHRSHLHILHLALCLLYFHFTCAYSNLPTYSGAMNTTCMMPHRPQSAENLISLPTLLMWLNRPRSGGSECAPVNSRCAGVQLLLAFSFV